MTEPAAASDERHVLSAAALERLAGPKRVSVESTANGFNQPAGGPSGDPVQMILDRRRRQPTVAA